MAMPALDDSITTIEALLALPEDGLRHELLDGEHVMTPSPALPHQAIVTRLMRVLDRELQSRRDALLFTSPADIILNPRTLVQPDLFVVAQDPDAPLQRWADAGIPLLVIEIVSPSTAARDRGKKRWIYQRAGIGDYWIVDLDARLMERWHPSDARPEIIDDVMRWSLRNGASGEFHLREIFGP